MVVAGRGIRPKQSNAPLGTRIGFAGQSVYFTVADSMVAVMLTLQQ
jgi:hypothetical protein